MVLEFYWYPNCGSCKKAVKWFKDNGIDYKSIHIVEETPTKEKILGLMKKSDLPARRFFNTSGRVYRERNMKDKVKEANEEQMATFLASDGMLIKRPIVTDGNRITVGFKEDVFNETWL